MKKCLKITMIVMLFVIVTYALFITEEIIRLSHNSLAEPLIVFEEEYTGDDGDVTYKSLGFTLTTEFAKFSENKDYGRSIYLYKVELEDANGNVEVYTSEVVHKDDNTVELSGIDDDNVWTEIKKVMIEIAKDGE